MKALVVDDHSKGLGGLHSIVRSLGQPFHVVMAESANSAKCVLAIDASFDIILIDLRRDADRGVSLLAELLVAYPDVPVVVLPSTDGDSITDPDPTAFLARIATRTSLSTVQVDRSDVSLDDLDWKFRSTAQASLVKLGLTARQRQVLALLLEGRSNKAIARELSLSVDTIKDHITALMRCLNVRSRTQAVLAATRLGRVDDLSAVPTSSHGTHRRGAPATSLTS